MSTPTKRPRQRAVQNNAPTSWTPCEGGQLDDLNFYDGPASGVVFKCEMGQWYYRKSGGT